MAELVVALDFEAAEQAMAMALSLRGKVDWVKVGLELYSTAGPAVVTGLKELGFKVFVDLKFMDIPNTVKGATAAVSSLGADMVNIHVLGGRDMAEAAREGLEKSRPGGTLPLLLGVTLLTSLRAEDLTWLPAGSRSSGLVLDLAKRAKRWGLDGIVCSGWEVESVKSSCGRDFVCLTPGIRVQPGADDQQRVVTPERAVRAGSDFLVVGRPITRADDPARAVEDILTRMTEKDDLPGT